MARGARLPEKGTARARPVVWRAGKELYRVHSHGRAADCFNVTKQDHHFGGGRFDSTANDTYSYLYAAPREVTALVERLVRGLRFDALGSPRFLPHEEVAGKRLSRITLARDVTLVSLRSITDLNAVQQSDGWLVRSDATEYAFTRRWGHWLRAEADWADGFVWRSRLDEPNESLVLFGAGEDTDLVEATEEPPLLLDTPDGLRRLRRMLKKYRVEIGPSGPENSWS